jgi:hypothetical protein
MVVARPLTVQSRLQAVIQTQAVRLELVVVIQVQVLQDTQVVLAVLVQASTQVVAVAVQVVVAMGLTLQLKLEVEAVQELIRVGLVVTRLSLGLVRQALLLLVVVHQAITELVDLVVVVEYSLTGMMV